MLVGPVNGRQRAVLAVAAGVAIAVGLFPPWKESLTTGEGGAYYEQAAGHHFLAAPPRGEMWPTVRVDYGRLAVYWVVTLLAALVGVLLLGGETPGGLPRRAMGFWRAVPQGVRIGVLSTVALGLGAYEIASLWPRAVRLRFETSPEFATRTRVLYVVPADAWADSAILACAAARVEQDRAPVPQNPQDLREAARAELRRRARAELERRGIDWHTELEKPAADSSLARAARALATDSVVLTPSGRARPMHVSNSAALVLVHDPGGPERAVYVARLPRGATGEWYVPWGDLSHPCARRR